MTSFDPGVQLQASLEYQALLLGKMMSEKIKAKQSIKSLQEVEFKVFSQWGDDGIIQWLVHNLEFSHHTFVEFGVANYRESNTRFLLMNNNWSGFVMDGSEDNVKQITTSEYYWRYELAARAEFIDRDNINELIQSAGFSPDIGILHIDLDGNDYWIWKTINVVSPIIVILEYNSVLGIDRPITIPYDKAFYRTKAHYSNHYYGASLRALYQLSQEKGYSFIGCNGAGNNAYFVRNDRLNDQIRATSLEDGYVLSKYRESRDPAGNLSYVTGKDRIELIRGMPVYNIDTDQIETL
ncbi:hypothetical protein [Leptothoe spongobia]|uniref:Uncharacterized protein n=1 Tax=Leptothoe spongobia TAU-MAC 1115 TaxID=1967444 RepID=A0A947DI27_9CYAN|nr:hypothetical protein [Leptothoe spongobia]MBT9317371.1 hypothetical protein [Leptothoe spongobia TAU-MAC 1115]